MGHMGHIADDTVAGDTIYFKVDTIHKETSALQC